MGGSLDTAYQLNDCSDCGKRLTVEEDHYYGHRCEACERKWSARLTAWKNGAEDSGLDRYFGLIDP
jgi:DNA-directed RNA polymerase subunit RPC12/RpoP